MRKIEYSPVSRQRDITLLRRLGVAVTAGISLTLAALAAPAVSGEDASHASSAIEEESPPGSPVNCLEPGDPWEGPAMDCLPGRRHNVTVVVVPDIQSEDTDVNDISNEVVAEAADLAARQLAAATDGNILLDVNVITAPESVGQEIRAHWNGPADWVDVSGFDAPGTGVTAQTVLAGGPACIQSGSDYTPARVAARQMPEFVGPKQTLVVVGGAACGSLGVDGQYQGGPVGMAELSEGATRHDIASIYPSGWLDLRATPLGAPVSDQSVSNLADVFLHEGFHANFGDQSLGHMNGLECPGDERPDMPLAEQQPIVNLDELIRTRLELCEFREYDPDPDDILAMTWARPVVVPNVLVAKDMLTAAEVDRLTSDATDRSVTVDEPNEIVTLVDRHIQGSQAPYGVLLPLAEPIVYQPDPDNEDWTITYTGVTVDYTSWGGVGTLRVYLVTPQGAAWETEFNLRAPQYVSEEGSLCFTLQDQEYLFTNPRSRTLTVEHLSESTCADVMADAQTSLAVPAA